jgi:hypothetical protein
MAVATTRTRMVDVTLAAMDAVIGVAPIGIRSRRIITDATNKLRLIAE